MGRGSISTNGGPAAALLPDEGLRSAISEAVDSRRDRLVKLRHRLHATPEASGDERETSALVAEMLGEIGLEPRLGTDGIGVLADVDLGAPGDGRIALRCELDCVQVNDDKQVPYASTRPGLCHACGHDVHTSILVGTAAVLAERLDELRAYGFRHNLRLVFQPAEETSTGARSMIQQGAINGVEGIIAVHVDPFLEVGRVGLRCGPLTSACKLFEVSVRGRSGHTARPFEAIDPIPAATAVIDLFYQLAPRSMDSRYPLALTVASIQTGFAFNAIPDKAMICGTLRAARVEDIDAVQRRMEAVAKGAAEATGCEVSLEFKHSCPATDNDPRIIELFSTATTEMLGGAAEMWLDVPSLGGEDFAFYQELIPGAIVRLGAANDEPRSRRPLHSSLFDVNDGVLAVGTKLMTWAALHVAASFEGGHP